MLSVRLHYGLRMRTRFINQQPRGSTDYCKDRQIYVREDNDFDLLMETTLQSVDLPLALIHGREVEACDVCWDCWLLNC